LRKSLSIDVVILGKLQASPTKRVQRQVSQMPGVGIRAEIKKIQIF